MNVYNHETKKGDVLKKAEEERSETDEYSSSDSRWTSDEDVDDENDEEESSSESEDTLDEYGFRKDKKQDFLFQEETGDTNDNPNSNGQIADNSHSEDGIKTGYGSELIQRMEQQQLKCNQKKKGKGKEKKLKE